MRVACEMCVAVLSSRTLHAECFAEIHLNRHHAMAILARNRRFTN